MATSLRMPAMVTAGALAALLFAGIPTANAFYWNNWPGSGTPNNNPTTQPEGTTTNPEPETEVPQGNPEEPGAPGVPEPSTVLAGLIGLGAVGLARRLRKSAVG